MRIAWVLVGVLAVTGGVEGAGRRLHACVPSTTAQAKIDEATASAVGGELALAFAEITECGGSDDLESQAGSPLAISLSLAISEGIEAVKEECGGDVEAAAEAVASSVVKEVQNEVAKVNPEAEDEFSARSVELLVDVTSDLQARSVDVLEDTTEDRATIIAEKLLQAIQNILSDVNCGEKPPSPPAPPPRKQPKKRRCRWFAGRRVGADC